MVSLRIHAASESWTLVVDPTAIPGAASPLDKALGLLAGSGPKTWNNLLSLNGYVRFDLQSRTGTVLAGVPYPRRSWDAFPHRVDGSLRVTLTEDTIAWGTTTMPLEAFFLPSSISSESLISPTISTSPWWDSTAFGVVMGALDAALPIAFHKPSFNACLNDAWLSFVAVSALHRLKPWLQATPMPRSGRGKRPFPLRASFQQAYTEVNRSFFKDTGSALIHDRSLMGQLANAGILGVNALYAPTAWTKGPLWDLAREKIPTDLLQTGHALAALLACPHNAFPRFHPTDRTTAGSAHERLAFHGLVTQTDALLATHAAAYRKRRS